MRSPTDLEPRVSRALARGAARVEPPQPDWDALVATARRRRQTRIASAAIAAVLVLAVVIGIAASGIGRDSSSIAPATRSRGGTTTPTTTPPPPTFDPVPTRTPPESWRVVDYHGFRQFVPRSWTVQTDTCPSDVPNTVFLGAPTGRTCKVPSTRHAWIWLRPLDQTTDSFARSCLPGGFNSISGCQKLRSSSRGGSLETWLMEGLDVFLVASYGKPRSPTFLDITNTWQYTDGDDALGADYQFRQPLGIAMDYVARYLEGNCAALRGYADRTFEPTCPPADPTAVVRGAEASSSGGAVPTEKYRVNLSDGRVFEVQFKNQYSLPNRRVESRVIAVNQIDPNTPVDFSPPGTPDCVPVSSHGGKIAGCTPKGLMFGDPRARDAQYPNGPPVYARAESDKIVGYFVNSLGFVPNRLMERVDELRSCENALTNRPAGASEPLTTSCRRLLRDWGVPKKALQAK